MTTNPETNELSQSKRALLALKRLKKRILELESQHNEPIAVIGMGCRYPNGANSPDAFWRLLHEGRSGIREVPLDRWDVEKFYDPSRSRPGTMYTKHGGFLDRVDLFEPEFFGISPLEAKSMDPQQRLLLEVSWEALEDAGQPAHSLHGSLTGVFLGICMADYTRLCEHPVDITPHTGTGSAFCIAAGRLSYTLGLQGPNLAVDTACSSSLVAAHLACQSLRSHECDLALVGGVNLILSPYSMITFCKLNAISPTGTCRAFDSGADGFVRGEGCGVIVLKRLSDALASNDRILGLLKGSAVNQDGRSNGLTAPNGPSQVSVIQRALANAQVDPLDVSFIEAHGTGTQLGDPIEMRAIGEVLCENRSEERPLRVGSLKTNIGHPEGAAGIAGLIKILLAFEYNEIPPCLNLRQPNPFIDWEDLPVQIPTQPTPWVPEDRPLIAGVSSFGFSGTNAHFILEQPPEPLADRTRPNRTWHLLVTSGRTKEALREQSCRLRDYLAVTSSHDIADICHTSTAGRDHFDHRSAFLCQSREQFVLELSSHLSGGESRNIFGNTSAKSFGAIAFFMSGERYPQRELGQQLYETQPRFREAFERCDKLFQQHFGQSPVAYFESKTESPDETSNDRCEYAALFSLQFALATLWIHWGIVPNAVAGIGVGEFSAACIAGIFNLDDAVRLASLWIDSQTNNCGIDRQVPENTVEPPSSNLFDISPRSPRYRFISSDHNRNSAGNIGDHAYWRQRILAPRSAVLTMRSLFGEQPPWILILGGKLEASFWRNAEEVETDRILELLKCNEDEWHQILTCLAAVYVQGADVDWKAFDADFGCNKVRLPTYPFQRKRYWVEQEDKPSFQNDQSLEQVNWDPKHVALNSDTSNGTKQPTTQSTSINDDLLKRLRFGNSEERNVLLSDYVMECLANSLAMDVSSILPESRIIDLGLDSVIAASMITRWRKELGVMVFPRTLFDIVTVEDLASLLRQRLGELFEDTAADKVSSNAGHSYSVLGIADLTIQDETTEVDVADQDSSPNGTTNVHRSRSRGRFISWLPSFARSWLMKRVAQASTTQLGPSGRAGWTAAMAKKFALRLPLDLIGDAILPEFKLTTNSRGDERSMDLFLTGATGFVGAFLLHDLLLASTANIQCLVRCSSAVGGENRIRKNLEHYGLWHGEFQGRIIPVVGDLSKKQFGLDDDQFSALGQTIKAIYHCGAEVNFVIPYTRLIPPNVHGTVEVVRLACLGNKPIHHISTYGIWGSRLGKNMEDDDISQAGLILGGYSQTKWVSEMVMNQARQRGSKIDVYRLGRVTGHSKTGAGPANSFIYEFIKGCIQLGIAPNVQKSIEIIPIDYVSSAVVANSLQKETFGSNYHLINESTIALNKLWEIVQSRGYELQIVKSSVWWKRFLSTMDNGEHNALHPFIDTVELILNYSGPLPEYDVQKTQDQLRHLGIVCPKADEELLNTYFDFFIASGYLENPKIKSPEYAIGSSKN
jgi:thioester reductase-like protein